MRMLRAENEGIVNPIPMRYYRFKYIVSLHTQYLCWKRKREERELRRASKLHKSAHYIHLVRFMCWDQWWACVASGGAFMHSFIHVKNAHCTPHPHCVCNVHLGYEVCIVWASSQIEPILEPSFQIENST